MFVATSLFYCDTAIPRGRILSKKMQAAAYCYLPEVAVVGCCIPFLRAEVFDSRISLLIFTLPAWLRRTG